MHRVCFRVAQCSTRRTSGKKKGGWDDDEERLGQDNAKTYPRPWLWKVEARTVYLAGEDNSVGVKNGRAGLDRAKHASTPRSFEHQHFLGKLKTKTPSSVLLPNSLDDRHAGRYNVSQLLLCSQGVVEGFLHRCHEHRRQHARL